MSSAVSGSRCSSRQRDSRGDTREKYGFSVVAPIRMIVPSSTTGRSTSCWALLHLWTSSTKRTVGSMLPLARSMTFLASATPEATADSWTISPPTLLPRMKARVVFPLPAGPHTRSDGRWPDSTSAVSALPGPSRWRCPTTSSSARGRMRVARGTSAIPSTPLRRFHESHAEQLQLFLRRHRGRPRQQLLPRGRLGEGDDVADVLRPPEHHHHAVYPEGETAMGRHTVAEGLEHVPELLLGLLPRQSQHVEHPALDVGAVDPDAAAPQLVAVEHDVVGPGLSRGRIEVVGRRHCERVVLG